MRGPELSITNLSQVISGMLRWINGRMNPVKWSSACENMRFIGESDSRACN